MKRLIILVSLVAIYSSCAHLLDLEPIDYPTENTFYKDINGLQGAVIGAYDAIQSTEQYGRDFLSLMEVRGDNVKDDNSGAGGGVRYQISVFTETPANNYVTNTWASLYKAIFRCNLILQSVDNVPMSASQYEEIVGQASFIRALSYFHIVRLWGKAPLLLYTQTVEEARANKRDETLLIYEQIIKDLMVAKKLPVSWPDAQRGRVTAYAAQALLAKVYLYQKRYADVLTELAPVVAAINEGKILALVPMNETFPNNLKTSKDILFAVQYLKGGVGESVHQNNRYRNNDNGNVITLPPSEFESNSDVRKKLVAPTNSGQRPGKFNAPATNNETSSDFPVIRCAEVMLMYAEALNEQSSVPPQDAFDALNSVRRNAGISNKTIAELPTKEVFRTAVYHERRLELALECDRWFDILRTGQFSTVFPEIEAHRQLYPVPQTEIENVNDKTGWQNEGYTL